MRKNNIKNRRKKTSDLPTSGAFRRFLRIPDNSNVIDHHRSFVFLFLAMVGILIGISFVTFNMFVKQDPFSLWLTVTHLLMILLVAVLYICRIIPLSAAVIVVIVATQTEVTISMIGSTLINEGAINITSLLINTTWMSMLLILSIATHIRYFPYVQLLIILITMGSCVYITKDSMLLYITPLLGLAFCVLSVMGDFLICGVKTLQHNKDNLNHDQDKIFEFLNMNKDELFQLIQLTRRKTLSDKQKIRLIELLDEQTKATVLEVAADVVEKKQQNLSLLDNQKLGLTPYEKNICLMILKGMGITEIARKLMKTPTSVTTSRAKIRAKLSLDKDDNLGEALQKLVMGSGLSTDATADDNSESASKGNTA